MGAWDRARSEGSIFWHVWFWIFPAVRAWRFERVETGAGGGNHRLARHGFSRFAPRPFCLATWCTCPWHCCPGEVSLSHGPSRSHRSGSDRGRPVVWHPDPSRHLRAAVSHEPSGRPVSVCSFRHSPGSGLRIAGCGKVVSHGRPGRSMPWISSMRLRQ